jgi:hypothetical protein
MNSSIHLNEFQINLFNKISSFHDESEKLILKVMY